MTAHVDFTALIEEGRSAGLRPVFLTTQAEFLHSLRYDQMEMSVQKSNWDREEKSVNLPAMRDLVNPNGLGRFRVLVQEKNTGIRSSSNLLPEAEDLHDLRPPPLSSRHLQRAHTASTFELNDLWPSDADPLLISSAERPHRGAAGVGLGDVRRAVTMKPVWPTIL